MADGRRRVGRAGRARLRADAGVVAGADAGRHQALPVPRPGPADRRRAVDVRRPAVRRLGAAPGDRLPLAAGPVVLARSARRAARLGRPPAVDRHAVVRRRPRRAVARPPARPRRWPPRSPRRSSTSCRRTCCPYVVAHVGDAAAVGRPRLDRRPARSRAATRSRWRHAALVALVVATVGRRQRDGPAHDRPGAGAVAARRGRVSGRSRGAGRRRRRCASAGCRSASRCGGSRRRRSRAATAPTCSPTPSRWSR